MSANIVPKGRGRLAGLGVKVLAGLEALGSTLEITQMPPAKFEGYLDNFTNADSSYGRARSAQRVASNNYHAALIAQKIFLKKARAALTMSFGDRWNTMWAQAGFVQPRTAVPRRISGQLALAQSLVSFFEDNPSYEVASKDVTAADGDALREAVIAALDVLQPAKVTTRTAAGTLRTAQKTLGDAIRFVVKILSGTIAKDDPRWETFGLNIPAVKTTPAAPTGLKVQVVGAAVLLSCDEMAFATRYRFRRRIVGIDAAFALVASSTTPMALLENLPAGATVEFIAQAVAGFSQGRPCAAITLTLPSQMAVPVGPLSDLPTTAPPRSARVRNGTGIPPATRDATSRS